MIRMTVVVVVTLFVLGTLLDLAMAFSQRRARRRNRR